MSTLAEYRRENTLRMKSAMVVYALEQSLGQFVRMADRLIPESDESLKELAKGVSAAEPIGEITMVGLVANSYLNEVFDLAIKKSANTSREKLLFDLKKLVQVFELFNVRNAISHPNRPFHISYWHRAAAIATDPLIEQLEFHNVREAYICSEAGKLESPPDEWLEEKVFQVPNNLPNRLEHSITSLIGRSSEKITLTKTILSPRVHMVAVVAPGGIGKTALILDVLKDLSSEPSTGNDIDGIIFISLKRESLTARGLITQDSHRPESVDELCDELVDICNQLFTLDHMDSFSQLVEKLKNKRLLICLDNIESIVLSDQNSFRDFYLTLPDNWKICLTSRITIDGALTITLRELNEASSRNLVQVYAARTSDVRLEESSVNSIVRSTFNNPLAIRLTVDLYNTGRSLPSAIEVAERGIVEFSYNNLIETLSDNAICLLECLFAQESATKTELREMLGLDPIELSESLGQILRTSLVSRITKKEDEFFELSQSVRDLLRTSPRNLEFRNEIAELLFAQQKAQHSIKLKQKIRGYSKYHILHIPENLPDGLKVLIKELTEIPKVLYKMDTQTVVSLQRKFGSRYETYNDQAIFHFHYYRILSHLGDKPGGMVEIRKAIDLHPSNPLYRVTLARLQHDDQNYQEAVESYRSLISERWPEKLKDEDQKLAIKIFTGYLFGLLFTDSYDEILSSTSDWNQDTIFKPTLGAFRVAALKRVAENEYLPDPKSAIKHLSEAVDILEACWDQTTERMLVEAWKLLKEINVSIGTGIGEFSPAFSKKWLNFCAKRVKELANRLGRTSAELSSLICKYQDLNVPGNPFLQDEWNLVARPEFIVEPSEVYQPKKADESSIPSGYLKVTIYHIPQPKVRGGFSNYSFAQDESGEQYYINESSVARDCKYKWKNISIGDILFIKPCPRISQNEATSSLDTIIP